jgi:Concanavalin A-like lectin/glucanases superfamily/Bacterial Ig-like domain
MRRKQFLFSVVLLALVLSVALNGCKKDNGPSNLSLVSLKVGTIDLNGAVSPSNIPANPTITATFNTNVDAATATNANITLKRSYDGANIPLNISVAGAVVTIAPTAGAIGNGALFTLTITTAVQSTGKLLLLAELDRTFTTLGTFVPTGQMAHWSFENNAIDSVGGHNANAAIDITYAASRKTAAGMAAKFNGTTSIIEIPNGDVLETPDFTLAFWVMVDTTSHPQGDFIIGLGAYLGFQFEFDGSSCKMGASYGYTNGLDTTFSEDLWFPGNGVTNGPNGWQGWTFCKDLTNSGGVGGLFYQKWAHVVCTYEVATKLGTMYINGTEMKQQDFNLWPAGSKDTKCSGLMYGGSMPSVKNDLAFGFIQSRAGNLWSDQSWGAYSQPGANHFKGLLDDVRIFNRALTSVEVGLIYNSEKP